MAALPALLATRGWAAPPMLTSFVPIVALCALRYAHAPTAVTSGSTCGLSCTAVLHILPPASDINGSVAMGAIGRGKAADGSKEAPFRSVHDAAAVLANCSYPIPCASPLTTVLLHHGVHSLAGRALRLRGDAPQRWVGKVGPHGERAIVSGGVPVSGWKPVAPAATGQLRRWVAPLPPGAQPKTMRIGMARAAQASFPAVDNLPAARQYLYARSVKTSGVQELLGAPVETAIVALDAASLPAGWRDWSNVVAYTWPGSSWVGMRVPAEPILAGKLTDGLAHFKLQSTSGFSGLGAGNRVRFAGAPQILGQPGTSGIWAVDEHARTVHLLARKEPVNVWLPLQDRLVSIDDQNQGITMEGITFADADFLASGTQNGFNAEPSDPGIPHDAAIAVSNSKRVEIVNCSFLALAGCGVVAGNRTTRMLISASHFVDMGQSGVLFVGNDTTQARECNVTGNQMHGIGTILASAGGIVVSSASNISISHNTITDCARWGVAVRSNPSAGSWNNTIGPGNRIERTGLTTSDFGAISFIDHTKPPNITGNRIIGNCVRDTRGMRDTMWRGVFGQLLAAFWGRSVYLDDHTSFTEISGNIFIDSSVYHIFFHSGSNNTVVGNIFVNGSLQNPGTQILLKQISHAGPPGTGAHNPMHGNILNRNIFLAPPNFSKFYSGDAAADGAWANVSLPYMSSVDQNLYYQPTNTVNESDALFFTHDWASWRNDGWDAHSLLNVDPGFVDPASGDFRLSAGSAALGLGIRQLAHPYCPP